MTIKQQGGIFGRNPTFNDLTVDGSVTVPANSISGNAVDGGTAGVDNLIADDVITAGGTTVTHGANSDGTIRVEGDSSPAFAINDTGQSKEYFLTALGDFVQMRYADAGDTGGFANSTELLTMKATGDVTVNTGNLVIGTSGNGIDFSATSGTGTSELFSDYEEGSFTPVYSGSSGNPTVTYSTQEGYYTKIGRVVTFSIKLITASSSGGSGNLGITGLPFTGSTGQGASLQFSFGFASNVLQATPQTTNLLLYNSYAGTSNVQAPTSALTSAGGSTFLILVGQYNV